VTVPQLIDADQKSTGESNVPKWLREISQATTGGTRTTNTITDHFIAMRTLSGTGGAFDLTAFSRAPSTAETPIVAEIRTISSLKLERRLSLERQASSIDDDSLIYADSAVRDALLVIRRHNLSDSENVSISEDGILSIQWRNITGGAAMVFTGDGKVAVSVAAPGKLYSQKPIKIRATDSLPRDFLEALGQFSV
jgi:hypothetical protein